MNAEHVGLILNGAIFPLLGALFVMIRGQLTEIKGEVRQLKDNSITSKECAARHDGMQQAIELNLKPIEDKLNKLNNGGLVGRMQDLLGQLEVRMALVEHQKEGEK